MKLIINELSKIFKKKSTLVFIIIAVVSIILSCFLVFIKNRYYTVDVSYTHVDEYSVNLNLSRIKGLLEKSEIEQEKKAYEKQIKVYEFLLDNGVKNIINSEYKLNVCNKLLSSYEKIYSIDKEKNKEHYDIYKNNTDRLWKIFKKGTFEEYIQFNKDEIIQNYNAKKITREEYNSQIEEQEKLLKYEIGKYLPENTAWKINIINAIKGIENSISERYNYIEKRYIDDKEVEELKNQILINEYRLENNIAPYYTDSESKNNIISFNRYKYNEFANTLSIIFVGLLVIVIASQSISEEVSKGTIKFMLITPYKRYKILLAKIISILIALIIFVLLLSQISVLVGNIVFGEGTNNYLYVLNGEVHVMPTHLYESLQYILRIPELIIYVLLGIMLSTLTRNTAITTIITAGTFIGFPLAMQGLNNFVQIDYLKYLPFNNFDLIDKVLKLEIYEITYPIIPKLSLEMSIVVLSITAILLAITAFESFNKKDI